MTPKDVIRNTIDMGHSVLTESLKDLTDADLLVRPAPGANHIAWQLGHLVASEQGLREAGFTMPDLPAGFVEAHGREAATSDDPSRFLAKDRYLTLLEEQRAATLAALDALPEADLDRESPESCRSYAPTLGVLFNMIGVHEMMHAGQFAPVRRKLGKPVLF